LPALLAGPPGSGKTVTKLYNMDIRRIRSSPPAKVRTDSGTVGTGGLKRKTMDEEAGVDEKIEQAKVRKLEAAMNLSKVY
jgi:hypothetical protein